MTGGLVQDIHHSVLPNISPLITIGLTIGDTEEERVLLL